MLSKSLAVSLIAPIIMLSSHAQYAEDTAPFAEVPVQQDADAIALYDGLAPGSEDVELDEIWRNAGTERWATNVTVPTLLPILPDNPDATRAAIIVVPGGGFQFISMDNEGYPIADWLAERGIAAFVLKYRTMETPTDQAAFTAFMSALFNPQPGDPQVDINQGIPIAVADAQAALSMVREKSSDWGYDADKIGMVGFSAGAMTTLGVALSESEDAPKPDFIGYIYGPMVAADVREGAPPMFNAIAADDPLFQRQGFGLIESWQAAGAPVELHYYQSGGHGFGSYKRGVPSDGWFDQFVLWMEAQGLLTPPSDRN